MGWKDVVHKVCGRVLHPLNDDVMKEILENIKKTGADVFWKDYEFINGQRVDYLSRDIEIIKNKDYFTCFWEIENGRKIETRFSFDKLNQKGFFFEFTLKRPYIWESIEDYDIDDSILDDDFSWYIEKVLKIFNSYEIASLYAGEEYDPPKRLDEWQIQVNNDLLWWPFGRKIGGKNRGEDPEYIDLIKKTIDCVIQNGEKSGYEFENYKLDEETLSKKYFQMKGRANWGDFDIKIFESGPLIIDPKEKDKNIRKYIELIMVLCKGMKIKYLMADSLELKEAEEEMFRKIR